MKYVWMPEDVNSNYGQIVHRGPNTEHFLIGYERCSLNPCLVSLRDGMICHTDLGLVKFVEMLNEQGFRPYEPRREPIENQFIKNGRYRS
jgi:hypothetical protein